MNLESFVSKDSWLLKYRLPLILVLGLVLNSLSYLLALALRFDFDWQLISPSHRLLLPLSLLLLFRSIAYMYWNLNGGYWRYASTHDLFNIIKAHSAASIMLTASILLVRPPDFSRSVIFIELALSIIFTGGSRLLVRVAMEYLLRHSKQAGTSARDVLVIGAGESGHLLVKSMITHSRLLYRPIGVLDDSQLWQGFSIFGVRVLGPISSLSAILKQYPNISAVIVAIPTLSEVRMEQIKHTCDSYLIICKKVQSFEDLACIDADSKQESLSIENVLEKGMQIAHEDEIRQVISGRRVLITGAGGSIGAEMVRQVAQFHPAKLLLLDSCEYNLFKIDRELKNHGVVYSPIVGSIVDRARLYQTFANEKPEIVFHAAAYKHVPLMEENCYEAVKNNIVGTRNLLEVCVQFSVSRFVLISSDKAVAPSSVMGCSKLIAEMLVQYFANAKAKTAVTHPLSTAIVRFGNVINSTGSVVPIFRDQILSGGPLTLTHPDMERYFMSIREAVRLVLTAGTLGQKGEVYILDMGKPIKVIDVAKKMMALYGRRDIEIIYTGIRPGEKLSEELLNTEELRGPTPFQKVYKVQNMAQPVDDICIWVSQLEERVANMSNQEIKNAIFDFADSARVGQVSSIGALAS